MTRVFTGCPDKQGGNPGEARLKPGGQYWCPQSGSDCGAVVSCTPAAPTLENKHQLAQQLGIQLLAACHIKGSRIAYYSL